MPREGWKTVAVREAYFAQLEQQAAHERRSVANYVEHLLLRLKVVKPVAEVPAA
jgi:hypothetical protein